MGWSKLRDVERGAAVWRILSEAGFLPPAGENVFASLGGGMGGGGAEVKMTSVRTCTLCYLTCAPFI